MRLPDAALRDAPPVNVDWGEDASSAELGFAASRRHLPSKTPVAPFRAESDSSRKRRGTAYAESMSPSQRVLSIVAVATLLGVAYPARAAVVDISGYGGAQAQATIREIGGGDQTASNGGTVFTTSMSKSASATMPASPPAGYTPVVKAESELAIVEQLGTTGTWRMKGDLDVYGATSCTLSCSYTFSQGASRGEVAFTLDDTPYLLQVTFDVRRQAHLGTTGAGSTSST